MANSRPRLDVNGVWRDATFLIYQFFTNVLGVNERPPTDLEERKKCFSFRKKLARGVGCEKIAMILLLAAGAK